MDILSTLERLKSKKIITDMDFKTSLYRAGCDDETVQDLVNDYPIEDRELLIRYFEEK